MLHVDIPTPSEIGSLARTRSEGCISIYLRTTPVTQQVGESVIEFRNLVNQAVEQLRESGLDKRELMFAHFCLHSIFVKRYEHRTLFDQAFHAFWQKPKMIEQLMQLFFQEISRPAGPQTVRTRTARQAQ